MRAEMEAHNRRGTTAVLITGAAGFAGSHLAEECVRRGWEVHGTVRSGEGTENLAAVPEAAIHRCELSDADAHALLELGELLVGAGDVSLEAKCVEERVAPVRLPRIGRR